MESSSIHSSFPETPSFVPIALGNWVPDVPEDLKIKIGQVFPSFADCQAFYNQYARASGFSIRCGSSSKSRNGDKTWKTYVCSKEGFRKQPKIGLEVITRTQEQDPLSEQYPLSEESITSKQPKRKKRAETREGCRARVLAVSCEEGCKIIQLEESHVHPMVTPSRRHFLSSSREVSTTHKHVLCSASRVNVGPSKVFDVTAEVMMGHQNVGCTKKDFLNYQRSLKAIIKDNDAHMFIDMLKRRKETEPGFYFAYEVDEESRLKRVFWADSLSRLNYSSFGDILSFDTTHGTNKYDLTFCPFTGVDNHRKLICFGAALVCNQKGDSFICLFSKFLESMGGKQPISIITDQDHSIRLALSEVFKNSIHRFCIWHILKKVPEYVGPTINSSEHFHTRLKSCVWSSQSPEEFEQEWLSIMIDFDLLCNDWFTHIFSIKEQWAQVYFDTTYLGAVVRTTSGSESQNQTFSCLTNQLISLVEFWVRFQHAIDTQRDNEYKQQNASLTSNPVLRTELPLERHAREVYTHANFYLFQEEFWNGICYCGIQSMESVEGQTMTTVRDNRGGQGRLYIVCYSDVTEEVATCSCHFFVSQGIPCRHILSVLNGQGLRELPKIYILDRWTKYAKKRVVAEGTVHFDEGVNTTKLENQTLSNIWCKFYNCMLLAGRDYEKLKLVLENTTSLEHELTDMGPTSVNDKRNDLETYFGCKVPDRVEIHPPTIGVTKGRKKRIKSGVEKGQEKQKHTRRCRSCNKMTTHDSRNCPSKNNSKSSSSSDEE